MKGPRCDEGTNLRLRDFAVVPLMPTHDRAIKAKDFSIKLWLFSYPYVLGAQKNRLIETVGKYPLHHVAKSDTFRDAFTRKCIT